MNPESPNHSKPTVVGIGASAGGLAALKLFFANVPSDSGLAFVVVMHLSPDHESFLPEVLQPSVRIPVQQVTETVALEPNRVYVIPPNANLNAIDTHLRLSKLEERRRERAPIDHFFRTLAQTHDGHAIAVILTGTGSDGTLGIGEVKANGGLVIVQDPNDAEFDGMPQSAITTGTVDIILPVAEIPASILRYNEVAPRVSIPPPDEEVPLDQRVLLHRVFAQLKARTDRDFTHYKRSTMLRRIARRMQLNYIEDLQAYVDYLRGKPAEVDALADDLLITVTLFFRDAEVFQKLEKTVIPQLFEGKTSQDSIRLWSVGCSTGEEAYSLAMLLIEEAARHESPPQLQVFASDLHARSLERAREGLYLGDIDANVSEERLRRFFHRESGGYRIRKELRDLVVFAPHNILSDPPFSRQDLISCRNLLIYLERDVQRDVIELFHYALNREGTLLLGSAESMEGADLFRVVDKKLCLFLKRDTPPLEPRLPVFPFTSSRLRSPASVRAEYPQEPLMYGRLHQQMVEQYAPPSVLVSPDNKVIHLSERAGRYLSHPGGELTSSILKMVRPELRVDLQASLQIAREKKRAYDSQPIPIQLDGQVRPVVLHLRPALEPAREGFVLVIFEEREAVQSPSVAIPSLLSESETKIIENLQEELTLSRQRLQSIIEEYETSQEEMRSSSEEMQSTNEELRSTMEELETSKEELQSINEELQTVNQQNRHKVEELAQLSGDLQNLLSATDIATLFLDRELRIMRFTPKLGHLFNVRVSDRGRPISDLTHRLGYEDLRLDAETVLNRLVPVEREVQDDNGRWYLGRILPYRSTVDRIDGVVITFIDIDSRKRALEALRASEEQLRLSNVALVRANSDLRHFSYAVSHDMQEPLRMVTVYTQLLARGYGNNLDSAARDYMANAVTGAQRMEQLLNDLRDYWSVDQVSEPAPPPVTSSQHAFEEALKYLETQIAESRATITRDPLPDLHADSHALTLLFKNLISNAIKYRKPETEARIHVSSICTGADWTFTISDNGMGMDAKNLETIFAPFKRLHGKEYPGTGLGLAMCRKIVEKHKGRIWAESKLGEGSQFRFVLGSFHGTAKESAADSSDRRQPS